MIQKPEMATAVRALHGAFALETEPQREETVHA
jgi:hypothetical protein